MLEVEKNKKKIQPKNREMHLITMLVKNNFD